MLLVLVMVVGCCLAVSSVWMLVGLFVVIWFADRWSFCVWLLWWCYFSRFCWLFLILCYVDCYIVNGLVCLVCVLM